MFGDGMKLEQIPAIFILCSALALAPKSVVAFDLEQSLRELQEQYDAGAKPENRVMQNSGKSLSEAVEQVRRQTDGRVLSAETKVSGNREVHHIKVLTKDGKVKTHKVQGRKRGG
jgi:uncharacterized membrane protein YkoI